MCEIGLKASVEKLHLGPDDILVLRIKSDLSLDEINNLKTALRDQLGLRKIIILGYDCGVDFSVIAAPSVCAGCPDGPSGCFSTNHL